MPNHPKPKRASAARKQRPLRVLISVGPTREPIDPVRFISNYSTGAMGACLAAEALGRGHRVTVVSGPVEVHLPEGASVIRVERARQMDKAMRRQAESADLVIMAAAVADYKPAQRRAKKLARGSKITLALRATPDIIGRLPHKPGQIRVGFALETGSTLFRAKKKLKGKRLDLLLAQHATPKRPAFGKKPVNAWLLEKGKRILRLGLVSKRRVARLLLDKSEALWYGHQGLGNFT